MVTSSAKIVIMKANIINYFESLRDKNPDDIEVIITSLLYVVFIIKWNI